MQQLRYKKPMAKIYPAPGNRLPVWKQQELECDPSFRDLREQIEDMDTHSSKGIWSLRRGYTMTFKQEAAILKANTRKAKAKERRYDSPKIEREQETPKANPCCTIC